MPGTIRVFLLDDHEVVREGLRRLLERSGDIRVVGEASTARAAMATIGRSGARVALLDVRLPDANGVEVCRALRAQYPEIACLMLTSYDDDEALAAAVVAGASGYLLKEVRGTTLADSVRQVAAGRSLLDPGLVELARRRMRSTGTGAVFEDLTYQERRVLDLLAEGMTNAQIAERLGLAPKTVKNYVSRVLSKLGVERRTQAAVVATRRAAPGPPRGR